MALDKSSTPGTQVKIASIPKGYNSEIFSPTEPAMAITVELGLTALVALATPMGVLPNLV